jgi:hypothetical protein
MNGSEAQNGFPALPDPSDVKGKLPEPRSAAYVPSDLTKLGTDFDPSLPHHRVTQSGNDASFTPDWDSPTKVGFDGLAFATYLFNVKGYGGIPKLNYAWSTPPDKPGNAYFALANWDEDRWDWYRGKASSSITLPGTAPYLDFGGNMLVCVLRVGIDESALSSLWLGSQPPLASLTVSSAYGLAPLSVTLDASASSDNDGSIVKYEWDPQGDGTFEFDGGTEPTLSYPYFVAGVYAPSVRVTDNTGVYSVAVAQVRAADPGFMTYGVEDTPNDALTAAAVNSEGAIWLTGRLPYPDTNNANAMLIHYDPVTGLRSATDWDSGENGDYFSDLAVAGDDSLYLCGSTGYGQNLLNGLLQHWSSDGQILWSKTIGSNHDAWQSFSGIAVTDTGLYCCGTYTDADLSSRDFGFVMGFDLAGNKLWARSIISPSYCGLRDIVAHTDQSSGVTTLYITGHYANPTEYDILFAHLSTDGDVLDAGLWASPGDQRGEYIHLVGADAPAIYIAATHYGVSPYRSTVTQVGGGSWDCSSNVNVRAGGLFSSARAPVTYMASTDNGVDIISFDASLNLISQELLSGNTYSPSSVSGQLYGPDGLLLAGGYRGQEGVSFGGGGLSVADGGSLWQSFFPSSGSLVLMQSTDAPMTTADVSGYFDADGDTVWSDPFAYLGHFN